MSYLVQRWLLALVAFYVSTCLCQQNCYYPNGVQDPKMLPCNTSAENSACCYTDSYCLTNGLCFQQTDIWSNRISRVGCTDRSWKDPSCPQYCQDVGGSGGISLLIGRETPYGDFCCGAGFNFTSEQCYYPTEGSYEPITLEPGYIILDRTGVNTTNYAGLGIPGPAPSTAESSEVLSATTTSTSSMQASSVIPTPSSTPAQAADQSTSCGADGEDDAVDSSSVAIGAGLGAGLGVAFLVMTALFIWQFIKNRKLKSALKQYQSVQLPPGYPHGGQPQPNAFGQSEFSPAKPMQYNDYNAYQQHGADRGLAEMGGYDRQELDSSHNR